MLKRIPMLVVGFVLGYILGGLLLKVGDIFFVLGTLVFGFWAGFILNAVMESGATEDLIIENEYLKSVLSGSQIYGEVNGQRKEN